VLGDNSFKIVLARQSEQPLAVRFDMVAVVQALPPLRQDRAQPQLATPEQQVSELRFAMVIEAHDLAIQHP
jgi:hypothetical protein